MSEKSIQRDIEDLRTYLSEYYQHRSEMSILYSERKRGYHMQMDERFVLSHTDIFVLAKVLLESRAFPKAEMRRILDKLIEQAPTDLRKHIRDMVNNEMFLYVPVRHDRPLFDVMWDLSFAVKERRVIEITYQRVNEPQPVLLQIEPLGIMFSEYYFYMPAYLHGVEKTYPAVFRLDRIVSYQVTNKRFSLTEQSRFQEGLFRRQVQFMQTGQLMRIKFRFWNKSLESMLDRLPDARVTMEGEVAVIEAEVFGKGIMMWLLSQGPHVEVLAPADFREEMKQAALAMANLYR